MSEATRIIGEAIGNPGLKYVQFSEGRSAQDVGRGRDVRERDRGDAGDAARIQRRDRPRRPREAEHAENTTPTTLERFPRSPSYAHAYRVAA